jgi:thiosulfate/3-mercaptopyruvate sulfurtransferase
LSSGRDEITPVTERRGGPADLRAVVGRDGVLSAIDQPNRVILDFRSAEEYFGERVSPHGLGVPDHGAERAGRIPTARHFYYRELLNDDWTFKPADQLRAALLLRGVTDDDELIGYCRLSHRASLGWVALNDVAAIESMRVYDGSWTEWGSMVGMPIER